MDWKEVGGFLLKQGLPLLGGLLGGPPGALGAKAAVSIVSSGLGLKEDADPEDVLGIIKANPEKLLELRKAEMAHKERLQELLLEEAKLEVQDRAGARSREVSITQATGKRDINLYVLAWLVVGGFFGLCGTLVFVTIPGGSDKIVYLLFGGLVAGFTQVLNYFFGSSKSSSDKTKLLSLPRE